MKRLAVLSVAALLFTAGVIGLGGGRAVAAGQAAQATPAPTQTCVLIIFCTGSSPSPSPSPTSSAPAPEPSPSSAPTATAPATTPAPTADPDASFTASGVTMYATKLSGSLLGVPVTFTPSNASAVLLDIANLVTGVVPLTMTNVTADQTVILAGQAQKTAVGVTG